MQNAYVESFHGKLRDECLNASWVREFVLAAGEKIGAWKEEYNEERPHSSLKYMAPREFVRRVGALRSPAAPCAPQLEERHALYRTTLYGRHRGKERTSKSHFSDTLLERDTP